MRAPPAANHPSSIRESLTARAESKTAGATPAADDLLRVQNPEGKMQAFVLESL
jgi:hypothetical protein